MAEKDDIADVDSDGPRMQDSSSATVTGLNRTIWLNYNGPDGPEIDRLVIIHQVSGAATPNGLVVDQFQGFCWSARASRTFFMSEAVAASEGKSGETIADFAGWLAALARG